MSMTVWAQTAGMTVEYRLSGKLHYTMHHTKHHTLHHANAHIFTKVTDSCLKTSAYISSFCHQSTLPSTELEMELMTPLLTTTKWMTERMALLEMGKWIVLLLALRIASDIFATIIRSALVSIR